MKRLLTKSLPLMMSLCLTASLLAGCDRTSKSSDSAVSYNEENADSNTRAQASLSQEEGSLKESSALAAGRSSLQASGTASRSGGNLSSKESSRKDTAQGSEESSAQGSSELTLYQGRILELSQNILDMNDSVNEAVTSLETAYSNKDQEAYKESLDTLTGLIEQLKDAYKAIAEEPAPDGLKDKMADLETTCQDLEDMLDLSMRVYELGYKGLQDQLTDDEISEMTEDQAKLSDLAASTDNFQNALTAILSVTDEDLSENGGQ